VLADCGDEYSRDMMSGASLMQLPQVQRLHFDDGSKQ
jgi:hypothetical protein